MPLSRSRMISAPVPRRRGRALNGDGSWHDRPLRAAGWAVPNWRVVNVGAIAREVAVRDFPLDYDHGFADSQKAALEESVDA
jgi:hypothetical protein